jgi:hypothetical protein
VIEVKRSLQGGQIEKIQSHAGRLHDAFVTGKKQLPWSQWSFAFRSPSRSHDSILNKLNETYDPQRSTGLLLVLDAHVSAVEHDAQITSCIIRNDAMQIQDIDRNQLQRLLTDAAEPHSCLFGRMPSQGNYVSQANKRIPPLLEFVTNLCSEIDCEYKGSITYTGSFQRNTDSRSSDLPGGSLGTATHIGLRCTKSELSPIPDSLISAAEAEGMPDGKG